MPVTPAWQVLVRVRLPAADMNVGILMHLLVWDALLRSATYRHKLARRVCVHDNGVGNWQDGQVLHEPDA